MIGCLLILWLMALIFIGFAAIFTFIFSVIMEFFAIFYVGRHVLKKIINAQVRKEKSNYGKNF